MKEPTATQEIKRMGGEFVPGRSACFDCGRYLSSRGAYRVVQRTDPATGGAVLARVCKAEGVCERRLALLRTDPELARATGTDPVRAID